MVNYTSSHARSTWPAQPVTTIHQTSPSTPILDHASSPSLSAQNVTSIINVNHTVLPTPTVDLSSSPALSVRPASPLTTTQFTAPPNPMKNPRMFHGPSIHKARIITPAYPTATPASIVNHNYSPAQWAGTTSSTPASISHVASARIFHYTNPQTTNECPDWSPGISSEPSSQPALSLT